MTHFTVGIILPKDVANPDGHIETVMEPFFEHSEAEPYVCYSLEQAATDLSAAIRRLELILGRQDSHYDLDKCRQHLDELSTMSPQEKYLEFVRYHEKFNEQGQPISTYNPNSKWDWYVIGGRWDGWLHNRKAGGESLADNTALTEQVIARDKITHAIVTPDGQWFERGQMGWWAILLTENENWDREAQAILARYPGHKLVLVDAHI